MKIMTASDELLLDPEYRKEKISTLQKESDAFTMLKRERTLTESEERAYKSITGEFARVFTLISGE